MFILKRFHFLGWIPNPKNTCIFFFTSLSAFCRSQTILYLTYIHVIIMINQHSDRKNLICPDIGFVSSGVLIFFPMQAMWSDWLFKCKHWFYILFLHTYIHLSKWLQVRNYKFHHGDSHSKLTIDYLWFVENTEHAEVIVENNSLENITSECKMSKLT